MEPLSVLIADDEEDLAAPLAERLELRGFRVEIATNGTDALERAAQGDFGVLLLDVKMPGRDGLELLAEIKKRKPGLPVILFTGHGSSTDAERGMEAGACAYLMKPIDIEVLIEKIGQAARKQKGSTP